MEGQTEPTVVLDRGTGTRNMKRSFPSIPPTDHHSHLCIDGKGNLQPPEAWVGPSSRFHAKSQTMVNYERATS